jgi:hypothetical protein
MIAFALVAWRLFDHCPVWPTLGMAIVVWAITALLAWTARKTPRASRRKAGSAIDLS